MNYSSDYSALATAAGGLVAGALVVVGILVLFAIAIVVLQIIGTWKILSKGGKPGWGALIPIYNQYLLCDMVGVSPWWILIVFVAGLLAAVPILGPVVSLVASIYFSILLNVSLARSFGKDDSYAVGLILLQPIFYLILGVGKSEFQGKKPMDDVVFNAINKNSNTNGSTTSNTKKKFCTSCGAEMDPKSKFCPSCGKETK